MDIPQVRDILYFDFEKASSIWSQLQWGQLEKISVTSEESTDHKLGAGLGIPNLADVKLNVGEGEKRTILETRILHHDLLNRIESLLSSAGLVTNINQALTSSESSIENIHGAIGETPYIIATGSSVIEDYQRIFSISEKFNDLAKFIGRSAMEGVKSNPEYLEIEKTINELKEASKSIADRNKKAQAKAQIHTLENNIEKMLQSQVSSVDQWILDGVKLWITTFMPTRINFRVYPFPSCPSFQVLCNLKRDSFVDQDLEHLLYGYGTRPNIPLAIFGLITSIPPKSGEIFDPLIEFEDNADMSKEMIFEKAFRGMFGAMDGLENFVKYSRYPNITVHPIAVFRPFNIKSEQETAT
jgi:hypothetical protein